ncbi:HNH endonuclease signature motif containing protein [Williamsia sp. DF01-3]|uniref:HNH endonuclease signature motif containing protein n=1 Tax=Williamsia sp. DF01-3 TaxID=2934157 RepID=UPI001FF119AE|nr:HNH endonuclease signature motif containing protein [Williamsia sp. DF01-3]MCK0519186.1 HNH endonuclease [Williamsia sp. DF01-3]
MTDSVTVDPPSMPVLVGLYRDLDAVLQRIAGASATDVDDVQVAELVRVNERVVRALTFQGLKRLQEVNDRGLFRRAGHSTLHRFVMSELRVSRGDASSRLKALDAAGVLLSMQGEVLPPKCPAAAEALAEGAIGLAHMDVMLKVRDKIPHKSAPEVYDVVDTWLTDNARTSTPTELEVCGREVLARVDPDGSLTDDADRKRNRGLSDGPQGLDMMAKITGNLDPQTLALFRTVMDVWAAPGMNNPDDPNSPTGAADDPSMDPAVVEAAAGRDTRSRAQRQHDAFKAILKTILEYKLLGSSHRGLPVQVIITMTKQQLDEAAGIAHTASGVDVPVKDALELAARAEWSLAVFANHSADVLYFARAKRTAQQGQRMALFAKDRGCTSPGCRNPISWSEIHHTTAWVDGGRTDIDELAPACIPHHAMIGPGEDQWQTIMLRDGPDAGRVAWIPPKYIDPDQQPRINRAHHTDHTIEAAWQKIIAERQAALNKREERMQVRHQTTDESVANPDSDDTGDCDDSTN